MVFVPLPLAETVVLRGGSTAGPQRGFAATPSLRAALGPDTSEEEADYAALDTAGVAALDGLAGSRRLVVAVEAAATQVHDQRSDLGEVAVEGLRWDQLQALFADGDDAADAVLAAAAAASGVPVADALALPAVVALSEGHDLLWYASEELDALI